MELFFLRVLNLSIQASLLIAVVLLLRTFLKKSPKWIQCLLWALVAIRLVCPFSIESACSLAPDADVISMKGEADKLNVQSGIAQIDRPANAYLESYYSQSTVAPEKEKKIRPVQILSFLWLFGVLAMGFYAFLSYIKIGKRVKESVKVGEHIYICDRITTPFILGIFRPRIYLPSNMDEEQGASVLAHEQAHIKRGDHFWKPFGYCLLAVYWFCPFCWFAYILLCRDIEMACDEKVIKNMNLEQKKIYSKVLLSFSEPGKLISACPLAFGEVGVKQRIKSVLNYKKPAFWIIAVAIVAIALTSVLFLTDPKKEEVLPDMTENIAENMVENTEENAIVDPADEGAVSEKSSEEYIGFIRTWADAFCARDGQAIAALASEEVQASFEEREILQVGTGYSIVSLDERNQKAEILYYAWTSDPHVTVWKESITFENAGNSYAVTEEELHMFDYIASGMEFDEAYPMINGTLMDYTKNGMGEALVSNAMLSSSTLIKDLQDPIESVKLLLNLLDNPNKVAIDTVDTSEDSVNLRISFKEDGVDRLVTMVHMDDTSGVWIPQDYGTDPTDTLAEAYSKLLQEQEEMYSEYAESLQEERMYSEYVETLQAKISEDMMNGKLPFVVSSAIKEDPLRLEVAVLEMTEENINIIRSYETNGTAITIVQATGAIQELQGESTEGQSKLASETFQEEENMGVDYEEVDGQYIVDGDMVFRYKKVLSGKDPNAKHGMRFVVLTNDENITYEQVAKSLYSSNSEDWLYGTIIIGMNTEL